MIQTRVGSVTLTDSWLPGSDRMWIQPIFWCSKRCNIHDAAVFREDSGTSTLLCFNSLVIYTEFCSFIHVFYRLPTHHAARLKRRWTPKQSGHMWWDDMEPGIVTPWLLICCSNSLQPSVFSPSSRSSSCCRDFLPFRHCSDTFPASLFHTSLFNFTVFLNIM